jgi:flagellar biosynthesis anti-sigma factor FlgM
MKIGPIDTKLPGTAPAERKAEAAPVKSPTVPSTEVALSPAAKGLAEGGGDAAFDSAKVERIATAIRDGKFTVNPEAIADCWAASSAEQLAMITTPQERQAVQQTAELERPLQAVEEALGALSLALHQQDAAGVDRVAAQLHAALAAAVDHFARAARSGGVPMQLRQRLATASGQVAAQREALARATASLDRAMDVLMPSAAAPAAGLYAAHGGADRVKSQSGGPLLA